MAELAKAFVKIGSQFDDKGVKIASTRLQKFQMIAGRITAGLKTMALAGAAMGAAIALGAKKAADAAGIQEKRELALAQAMKTAGTFTEEAFLSNIEYAASLQKITTFGDETILTVQKLLTNYGAQGKELDDLTKATLDFATATGMSLEGAAALVGKTIGSTTNALTRYGITVEGAVSSTERMQSAVEGISKLFGGAAQADALTYEGRMKQLNNRWGDFIEQVGFKVIPIFETLIDVIDSQILPIFETWIENMGEGTDAAETFGKALEFIIKTAMGVITVIDVLSDGIAGFVAAVITRDFKAMGIAIESMKEKFVRFGQTLNDISDAQAEKVKENEQKKTESRRDSLLKALDMKRSIDTQIVVSETEKTEKVTGLQKEVEVSASGAFENIILGAKSVGEAVPNIFEGVKNAIVGKMADVLASSAVKGVLSMFTGGGGGVGLGLFGFQKGIRNFAGGMALVGEKGPEIAKFPGGTNIIPAGPSRSEIHNMNKGGDTFIINVNQVSSVAEARRQARAAGDEWFKSVGRSRRM
jgi:hypothetical protein